MKVICVVDSISNINSKIDMIKSHFGSDICFVVKATLEPIFKTFGYIANAIYYNQLTTVIHALLLKSEPSDVLIYYTSLKINENLLNKFNTKIASRNKVVSLMPRYNTIERMNNSAYNVYVKAMFKIKDSMVSPKLQFLPESCAVELLNTHIGNKLFEWNPKLSVTLDIEDIGDKEINKSAKTHTPVLKTTLISIIIALIITMCLLITLAFANVGTLLIIMFVCLYLLDIVLTLILQYKSKFDHRFLK